MPRRKRELPAGLTEEALDALAAGVRTEAEFDVMFRGLKQALTERILRAELTEYLGYPEGEARPADTTKHGLDRRREARELLFGDRVPMSQ